MAQMKTPGVYVVEKNAFPNSVVQVATAVPAFIGYTEVATLGNNSLHMKPFRLSTMAEYEAHFGAAPNYQFEVKEGSATPTDVTLPDATFKVRHTNGQPDEWRLEQVGVDYCLYSAMRLFFQNGGGVCYVVSIGQYGGKEAAEQEITAALMIDGIKTLIKEPEPTMVVIPETTRLSEKESISVQQAMLKHCGYEMRNRFALLDLHKGHLELQDTSGVEPVEAFRNALGTNQLDFGAAYYPWVESTAFTSREFTFENIVNRKKFASLLKKSIQLDNAALAKEQRREVSMMNSPQLLPVEETGDTGEAGPSVGNNDIASPEPQEFLLDVEVENSSFKFVPPDDDDEGPSVNVISVTSAFVEKAGTWSAREKTITFTPLPHFSGEVAIDYEMIVDPVTEPQRFTVEVMIDGPSVGNLDQTLRVICPLYADVMNTIAVRESIVSPGALMAGIYSMVDNTRGVWKAPANVSLNSVLKPTVKLSHEDQEDLNVSAQGKSINAIRPFVGEGTLVWGARTLDGNSLDWRYINVRRTMIMIEESIRLASKAYVFEPNVANTWVTIKSMIDNFLNSVWKQGGLAGSVPADAYSVHVGLGDTMTPTDILEGILRVTVLVAISRPAEFIEVTFQQQMQKS